MSEIETRVSDEWRPCSDSYLRGYCLSTEKYRETRERLEHSEVVIKGRSFRLKAREDS